MSGRPTVCSHGTPLYNSWRDCPKCVAEMQLEEQSRILEDIAYNIGKSNANSYPTSTQQSSKSKLIESQELARLAEERFRMHDLRGAVQLITEAIEIQPTFVSFYLQRARYFASQDKNDQAISDLRYSFKVDKEVLFEIENQLKTGKLINEFIPLKPNLENLIREIKDSDFTLVDWLKLT